MSLLDAGGGSSISLMAGGAAELVRIMNLQQLRRGMTGECPCIVVGLLTFSSHRCRAQLNGLTDSHVAGFAAINDVGFGNVDLHDQRIPRLGLILQTANL